MLVTIVAGATGLPALAQQQARVTNLNNIAFGTVNPTADISKSDNVCVYSSSSTKNYTVLATGSGNGGAFELTTGSATMAYELEWTDSSGQTSGTPLTSGTTSRIFNSPATSNNCLSATALTASDTIRLRAAEMSAARAGAYTGTLYITITPQ